MSGTVQLANDGILISNSLKSINPNTISDGNGGAIIAWQDSTSIGWDIKSQKVTAAGVLQWAVGGITICDAIDDQINASQVTDKNGGAVYVWEDHRNGSNYDLYANHVYDNGTFYVGIKEWSPGSSLSPVCYPNPINNNSIIKLSNNTSDADWELKIYNALGVLIHEQQLTGTQSFHVNSFQFSSGVYLYTVNLKNEKLYSKGYFISAK